MIFKSRREGYDIRIIREKCKFNETIMKYKYSNNSNIIGINDLIYVDINGRLCCTKTLESAIKLVKYNEENQNN